MKLRTLAAAACLAAAALFTAACGTNAPDGAAAEQTADPKAELKAAFEKSAQQTQIGLTVEIEGMYVTTAVDKTAKTMYSNVQAGGNNVDMYVNGDDVYTRYNSGPLAELIKPQLDGKEWLKTPLSAQKSDPFAIAELFKSDKLLPEGAAVTKQGKSGYTIASGGGDVGGLFKGLAGDDKASSAKAESTEVTVSPDGLVSQLRMVGASNGKLGNIAVSYGQPVEFPKPDPGDVMEKK